jgi:hypothetical protein
MAPLTFKKVTLGAEHVPETHTTRDTSGGVTTEELPGMVHIVVNLDGAKVVLATLKAPRVLKAIAKRDAEKKGEPADDEPEE